MKAKLCLLLILISVQTKAQCRKTFLYGFSLPPNVVATKIDAMIYYKGKPIASILKTICGKLQKIETKFTFLKEKSNWLNGQKLPYTLPGGNFYWLLDDEMATEMATNPNHFQICLTSTDKALKDAYLFPMKYDFVSQNTIYLDLIDRKAETLQKIFDTQIWTLSLVAKEKVEQAKDTIVTYNSKKIPAGLYVRFLELKNQLLLHSVQEFVSQGILYHNKLFLKLPENPKLPKPEAQQGNYVSLDGKRCATSGGILGVGFGECSGVGNTKTKAINYTIQINIEP
jgi:hypothetical protein